MAAAIAMVGTRPGTGDPLALMANAGPEPSRRSSPVILPPRGEIPPDPAWNIFRQPRAQLDHVPTKHLSNVALAGNNKGILSSGAFSVFSFAENDQIEIV